MARPKKDAVESTGQLEGDDVRIFNDDLPATNGFSTETTETSVSRETLPEPVVMVAEEADEPPCALDGAPPNSKIVVVMIGEVRTPVFATPAGVRAIAADDIAHRLPIGAKISVQVDGTFRSTQLDATLDKPDLITTTGREAIERFGAHFHDTKA